MRSEMAFDLDFDFIHLRDDLIYILPLLFASSGNEHDTVTYFTARSSIPPPNINRKTRNPLGWTAKIIHMSITNMCVSDTDYESRVLTCASTSPYGQESSRTIYSLQSID